MQQTLRTGAPTEQLIDLGFKEIADNLFLIKLKNNIRYYRDYRKEETTSYAYLFSKRLDHTSFSIHTTVRKLELAMKGVVLNGERVNGAVGN